MTAADPLQSGRKIYEQQCASCHGANGEGVVDKYDHALVGDWSLSKLIRVIDRTMPEDEPKKCVGKDAEAVAKYIYDAFYSPAARQRNQAARVELARLTNRQYQNTVADLLKPFTQGATPNQEHGLWSAYYASRNFDNRQKKIERTDRHVDFDFGEGSPDKDKFKAEEFSIQWRGSVHAEETGDYQIVVKTPNGVRLWLNGEDEPLIDAWVASGDEAEHTATIRLLGGRDYPLRLDFLKFKQKAASVSLHWKPPHQTLRLIPARNLNPVTTPPTLVITTPFPPDDSSVGYERGVSISKAWDEAATQAAIEVANHVLKHLDALARTKSSDPERAKKVEGFCAQLVETAFRRPLSAEQRQTYVTRRLKEAGNLENGVKQVVLLALKSPYFLYPGLTAGKPDDFTVATRLSYALWDSLPDRDLLQAASQSKLHTPDQINQQARRMLNAPQARAKVQYFLHHWLQMNQLEDLAKDAALYPDFTPDIIADLRTSLNLFLEEAVWGGNQGFRDLLLADYLFLNERLAKFYEIPAKPGEDFIKVSLDPKQRSGVVTHPYLLSAFSYQKSTSPIHRGVFLTRNIIGRALKPPPNAVEFIESDFSPNMTMREKVAKLTRSQACQTCHSVINPLGFSLEYYDAVGRYRTHEGKRPIDARSEYTTDEGTKVRLNGGRDLAEFALNSDQAQNGFIEQLFHHVVKQPVLAYGVDAQERLRESFVNSQFNVKELLVHIVSLTAAHGLNDPATKP